MYDYKKHQIKTLCVEILECIVGILFVAGILYGVDRMERYQCQTKYAQYSPEYQIITGCMITYADERVPASALRLSL